MPNLEVSLVLYTMCISTPKTQPLMYSGGEYHSFYLSMQVSNTFPGTIIAVMGIKLVEIVVPSRYRGTGRVV